jgi:hypothetical protein
MGVEDGTFQIRAGTVSTLITSRALPSPLELIRPCRATMKISRFPADSTNTPVRATCPSQLSLQPRPLRDEGKVRIELDTNPEGNVLSQVATTCAKLGCPCQGMRERPPRRVGCR